MEKLASPSEQVLALYKELAVLSAMLKDGEGNRPSLLQARWQVYQKLRRLLSISA